MGTVLHRLRPNRSARNPTRGWPLKECTACRCCACRRQLAEGSAPSLIRCWPLQATLSCTHQCWNKLANSAQFRKLCECPFQIATLLGQKYGYLDATFAPQYYVLQRLSSWNSEEDNNCSKNLQRGKSHLWPFMHTERWPRSATRLLGAEGGVSPSMLHFRGMATRATTHACPSPSGNRDTLPTTMCPC